MACTRLHGFTSNTKCVFSSIPHTISATCIIAHSTISLPLKLLPPIEEGKKNSKQHKRETNKETTDEIETEVSANIERDGTKMCVIDEMCRGLTEKQKSCRLQFKGNLKWIFTSCLVIYIPLYVLPLIFYYCLLHYTHFQAQWFELDNHFYRARSLRAMWFPPTIIRSLQLCIYYGTELSET